MSSLLTKFKKVFSCFRSPPSPEDLNVFTIIKPFYIILSMFGLFPFKVTYNNYKNKFILMPKSIYINILCALSHILVMVSFFAFHINRIFHENDESSFTDVIVTQLNYFAELLALLVFVVGAYIWTYINGSKYVKMLNVISSCLCAHPLVDNSQILSNIRLRVRYICFYLFIIILIHLIINFTRKDSVWKMLLVVLTFIWPQFIQFIFIYFVVVFVLLVAMMLRNVRDCVTYFSKNFNVTYSSSYGNVSRTLPLRQMGEAYGKAFQVTNNLNSCFQGPILLTAFQSFHSMVSESHIIYHGLVVGELTLHEIVNCGAWIIWQILKIFVLANAGGSLRNEVKKLQQALHEMPTEDQEDRTLLEIQHFYSRINCQTIKMTVFGFFPLDSSLTFRVLASAMMYLIILVQFDKSNAK